MALAAVGIFTTAPGSQALAQMPSSDRERGTHVNASVPASEPDLLAAEFLRLNGFEASVAHFQDHIRAFGIENISDPRPAEVKAPEQRKATQRVIDAELPVLRRNAIRVVREIWTEQEMADINAFLKSSSGRSFFVKSSRFQKALTPVLTAWAVETQVLVVTGATGRKPAFQKR